MRTLLLGAPRQHEALPGARGEMRYQSGCVRGKRDLRTSPYAYQIDTGMLGFNRLALSGKRDRGPDLDAWQR